MDPFALPADPPETEPPARQPSRPRSRSRRSRRKTNRRRRPRTEAEAMRAAAARGSVRLAEAPAFVHEDHPEEGDEAGGENTMTLNRPARGSGAEQEEEQQEARAAPRRRRRSARRAYLRLAHTPSGSETAVRSRLLRSNHEMAFANAQSTSEVLQLRRELKSKKHELSIVEASFRAVARALKRTQRQLREAESSATQVYTDLERGDAAAAAAAAADAAATVRAKKKKKKVTGRGLAATSIEEEAEEDDEESSSEPEIDCEPETRAQVELEEAKSRILALELEKNELQATVTQLRDEMEHVRVEQRHENERVTERSRVVVNRIRSLQAYLLRVRELHRGGVDEDREGDDEEEEEEEGEEEENDE